MNDLSDRLGFGLYLEASGPGEVARTARDRLGEEAMGAARAAWSGLLSPQTSPEEVRARLGPPDHEDGAVLAYLLPTRPGYHYVFGFDAPRRLLLRSEFRRAGPPPPFPVPPGDAPGWPAYAAKLSAVGTTAQEAQAWLGEPLQRYGWWPTETWEYPDGLLNLRHGVVENET